MAESVDLTTMSDDEINRRRFTVMKRICDEKGSWIVTTVFPRVLS